MQKLQAQFTTHMRDLIKTIQRDAEHNPTRFHQMVEEHGGVEAARKLINGKISETYGKLAELGRLDLTIEAQVLSDNQWHSLFSEEELRICERRTGVKRR